MTPRLGTAAGALSFIGAFLPRAMPTDYHPDVRQPFTQFSRWQGVELRLKLSS
jgi:hypothetical protein